jgi:hypothetical protein
MSIDFVRTNVYHTNIIKRLCKAKESKYIREKLDREEAFSSVVVLRRIVMLLLNTSTKSRRLTRKTRMAMFDV